MCRIPPHFTHKICVDMLTNPNGKWGMDGGGVALTSLNSLISWDVSPHILLSSPRPTGPLASVQNLVYKIHRNSIV